MSEMLEGMRETALYEAGEVSALLKLARPLRAVGEDSMKSAEYKAALRAYNKALRETIAYLEKARSDMELYSRSTERRLSELWTECSIAISTFDPDLTNRCFIKGQGWLDPTVRDDPRYKKYHIGINDMREAFMAFNEKQNWQNREQVPGWFPKAGVGFSVATFLSLFYLLVGPDLSNQKRIIFNAWMAFCIAASAAFLGGTAVANGTLKIPFMKDAPVQFSTYGGIAIFVVIFLILVAVN